ncbi:MAG TPA: aspartyl protease family protein [Verrucomicrobiae bacterium]|nr:aspartyl protease family protein [Verrucomicrobiae bacterium]
MRAAPIAEFPFEFHNGFLWVEVHVSESAEPLNFLLDSGASVSVINLNTARRLKLGLGHPVIVRGVKSTTKGFWPEKLSAKADQVPLQNHYLAVDLEQLGQACNCCVDGLIGADFFCDKVVQIDFAEHKIRLSKSSEGIDGQTIIALKMRPCGMEIPVQINSRKSQFVRLDTGCASSLQWVTREIQPNNCSQRPAVALTRFTVTETKSTVRLGNVEFQSVPTGIHAEAIFAGEAGLIGNGILSHFKTVTIDTKRGQLILGERD